MLFYLVSCEPLPSGRRIDAIHFDSEMTTCQVSTAIPGGFGGLSCGYSVFLQGQVTGRLGNPVDFVDLGHIQIFAQDERGPLVFEGRVQTIDSRTGLQATAVTATGYGVGAMAATTDSWYFSPPFTGEPAIGGGELLRDVITASAPLLNLGDKDAMYEPGGSYLRSNENGRYPNQIIDEVVKAGDYNNNQIIYVVYENRTVQLLPRVPPIDPNTNEVIADYYIPVDAAHIQWRRDSSLMVGAVAVQFSDGNAGTHGYTEISSPLLQKTFVDSHGGLLRSYLVSQSNWTKAQAEFFRDTYAGIHQNPVITASVNLDSNFSVRDRENGVIPYYLVRAGGWLKVGDQSPILITSTRLDLLKQTNAIIASSV